MSDRPPSFEPSETVGGAAPLGPAPSGTTSGGAGWKSWVAAGAVAAVVAVGAVVVLGGGDSSASDPADATAVDTSGGEQTGAPGEMPDPGFGGTTGTVEAVDGTTISVRDDSDEVVEVTTGADTQVVAISEATIDDLAVGDNVLVTGETGEDGIVVADSITDSGDQESIGAGPGGAELTPPDGMELPEGAEPPEGMELPEGAEPPTGGAPGAFTPPTSGAITAVDGSTVTVETAAGESVTVTVGADTTVTISSVIDVAEITEGASVIVMGEAGSGTVAATNIRVGDPELLASGFGGRRGGPGGDTTTTTTA
jgi:hypothetical protein